MNTTHNLYVCLLGSLRAKPNFERFPQNKASTPLKDSIRNTHTRPIHKSLFSKWKVSTEPENFPVRRNGQTFVPCEGEKVESRNLHSFPLHQVATGNCQVWPLMSLLNFNRYTNAFCLPLRERETFFYDNVFNTFCLDRSSKVHKFNGGAFITNTIETSSGQWNPC